jgi:uncharacterized protein (DUF952 family)
MIKAPAAGQTVYKIVKSSHWHDAVAGSAFEGSADDIRDGFIHLSALHQLQGTLTKHFQRQADLVLVAFNASHLGDALKWQVSRGGDKFPHLYAPLETRHALWTKPLMLDGEGVPLVPEDIA